MSTQDVEIGYKKRERLTTGKVTGTGVFTIVCLSRSARKDGTFVDHGEREWVDVTGHVES